MKEPLLYIFSSGLGENLLAAAGIEYLSKSFEVFVLGQAGWKAAFDQYKFITSYIGAEGRYSPSNPLYKLPAETVAVLQKVFPDGKCISHFSHCSKLQTNNPIFADFNWLPLQQHRRYKLQSLSSNVAMALGVPELEADVVGGLYDTSLRPLASEANYCNKVVVYEGSRERHRKLPTNILRNIVQKVQKRLPEFEVLVLGEARLDFSNHIDTSKGIEPVLDLFKQRPRLMIGPDSGLTHLALAHKIPQVWLETRVPLNHIHHPKQREVMIPYRKPNSFCDRTCATYNWPGKYVHYNELACWKSESPVPCISYTDQDVEEICSIAVRSIYS